MKKKRKEHPPSVDEDDSNWKEYLDSWTSMTFVQYYRCRSISLLNKQHVDDDGNRIIMPPSALERLGSLNIEYPMMFQIQNPAATERVSHCGVLEFVADEGFVHVPTWMMARLGLDDGQLVLLKNTSLPKATFLKLQPHATDFHRLPNPKELLEYNFSKYPCMTVGDTITVTDELAWDRTRYSLDVVEARPAGAVATIETDCEVDFATPLDYKPPSPPPPAVDDKPDAAAVAPFAGVGMRLDGTPVEQQQQHKKRTADQVVAPAAGSSGSVNGKRVLRFGGVSSPLPAAGGGKKKEGIKEEEKKKKEPERFAGKKYSLREDSPSTEMEE